MRKIQVWKVTNKNLIANKTVSSLSSRTRKGKRKKQICSSFSLVPEYIQRNKGEISI